MLVIINALKSIVRSKGRNILICLLAVTVAAASCVALAIRVAAKDAEAVGKANLTITGSIGIDQEKIRQQMQQGQGGGFGSFGGGRFTLNSLSLPLEELQTYASSAFVDTFYYTSSLSLNTSGDLMPYALTADDGSGDDTNAGTDIPELSGENGRPPMGGGGFFIAGRGMGDFSLTGYSSEEAMTDFVSGTAKLNAGDGSVLFDFNADTLECLVSSDLISMNLQTDDDGNPVLDENGNAIPVFGIGDTLY